MAKHGGKLLLEALDILWNKYRKCLKACRQEISEDNVHELRISTRRLLALIELLSSLHPHSTFRKLRKILKHQLDGLDELRDTQVMLLEVANSVPTLPGLKPFIRYLQQCEQRLLQQTGPHIASVGQGKLRRRIQRAGQRFKARTTKTDLNTSLLHAIDRLYATALERYQAIDATDLASIHHLRIPVKKLRYMLASVRIMLPELPDTHLKRLQTYLTRMGDIQNSAVLLKALEAFFTDGLPTDIQANYRKQQQDLINDFMAHREEIFDFWRLAPDHAMPWKTGNTAY